MPLVIHHNKGIYFTSEPINPFEGNDIPELDNLAKVYDELQNALSDVYKNCPEIYEYCFNPFITLLDNQKRIYTQLDEIKRLNN